MCSSQDPLEALEAAARTLAAHGAPDLAEPGGGPGGGAAAMQRAERLAAAVDLAEAALAALVAAVDADGAAKADGWGSTGAWMVERMRMRGYRAADRLRTARQLRRLPDAAKGFAAGDLSAGHISAIAETLSHLPDDDTTRAQPILVDLARDGGTADDIARTGRLYAQTVGDDDEQERSGRQHDRRYLTPPTYTA